MSNSTTIDGRPRRLLPTTAAYGLLVGIPAILIAVLLRIGEQLPAATAAAGAAATLASRQWRGRVRPGAAHPADRRHRRGLAARGGLLARLGQPRVVGEMAAGLVLGPSVFGRLAPSLSAAVFPAPSLGFVNAVAQVGLLLFMFLVGLELDAAHLRRRGKTALLTSHASIVAPFLLGTALALGAVPAARSRRRGVHAVRAVRRRGDERDGVPGTGADPRRSRDDGDAARRTGDRVRGGGRRHGVVHPRRGGGDRSRGRRGVARVHARGNGGLSRRHAHARAPAARARCGAGSATREARRRRSSRS